MNSNLTFRQASVICADDKARTLEIAFATDTPVDRGHFIEVLDMRALNVDRLNQQAPLLRNHDPSLQVGAVVPGTARVDTDKVARCTVKFSRSQAGTDAFNDAQDGIAGVSFGYAPEGYEADHGKNDGPEVRRYAVTAFEVSLVSIPADVKAGVGRSDPKGAAPTNIKVNIENKNTDIQSERARSAEITAIAGKFNVDPKESQRFIAEGKTVDEFRQFVLDGQRRAQPLKTESTFNGNPDTDFDSHVVRSGYSLAKVLLSTDGKLDGIEREANDELRRRNGSGKGLWIPHSAFLSKRSLLAGTAPSGGFMTGTEVMGDRLIPAFRPPARVARLGATILSGLSMNASIPKITTGATASWRAEVQEAGQSEPAFGQVVIAKKCITTYGKVSKELLVAGVDADAVVRRDFMGAIASAIDTAAVKGSGSAGEPLGIIGTSGVNATVTYGGAAEWADIVAHHTAIADDDAELDGAAFGWLISATTEGKWRAKLKDSVAGAGYLAENGQVGGKPYFETSIITSHQSIYGDWSQLFLCLFGGGLDVVIDPYTCARTREIAITLSQGADVVVRNPEAFSVSTDSAAQ
jgi:HK97 family phage major capsid protein